MRAIATAVHDVAGTGREPSLRAVLDALEDGEIKSAAVSLQTQTERTAEDRLRAYFHDCLLTARREARAGEPAADLAALVEQKRRQIEEFGPDRRRMARPGSPP